MRRIHKGPEPASLIRHRCWPSATYDDLPDKDDLRRSLCAEQRGLCAYCMARIGPDPGRMKIEHWHCRTHHPDEQLDYRNLLGCCRGGEGQPRQGQHCDTRKGEDGLSRNPALHPDIAADIHHLGDGTIRSDDPDWDREMDRTLNLNLPFLKANRRKVLDAFCATLLRRGPLEGPTLRRMLHAWNGDDGRSTLEPYCQVVVYWLERRLRRT